MIRQTVNHLSYSKLSFFNLARNFSSTSALHTDVVYVELPEKGKELKQGDVVGAIESVKAASDIYSPVSGVVTDINSDLENKPFLINKSTYDKGWLFKCDLSNPDEIKELLDEKDYKVFQQQEEGNE